MTDKLASRPFRGRAQDLRVWAQVLHRRISYRAEITDSGQAQRVAVDSARWARFVQRKSRMDAKSRLDAPPRRLPVLVQRTIRSDGSSERSLHIYCPDRGESVPLEDCWRCAACVSVLSDEKGDAKAVECLPAPAAERDIRSVGTALRRGVTVVDLAVSLGEVVALLAEKRTGVVAVTDQANRIAGVIHESNVLPQLLAAQRMKSGRDDIAHLALCRADETMVPSAPVLETKPLRDALLDMASSHSRCLIVVSGRGDPIGVLWDVDALHALFGTASR